MSTMNRPEAGCRKVLFIIVLFLITVSSQSQEYGTHTGIYTNSTNIIDGNINGYWEYLPAEYNNNGNKRFPLLIFMHGAGETGTGNGTTLNRILKAGPPKIINDSTFPANFTVKGNEFQMIVLSPQIKSGILGTTSTIQPSTIQNMINYAKANYRIDPTRVYLCGLSMGGGAVWQYIGSSLTAAKELAAVSIVCGAADLDNVQAQTIAAANLPLITTHNIYDNVILAERTANNVSLIRQAGTSADPVTYYWDNPAANEGAHNAWTRTFEEIQPETTIGGNLRDSLGMNVYEWLLQFARPELALPVKWESFNSYVYSGSVKLEWKVSGQLNVEDFAVERSRDGINWQSLIVLPLKEENGHIVSYEYVDEHPLNGTSLYRIREKDLDGTLNYSAIRQVSVILVAKSTIKLYPNPFSKELNLRFLRSIPSMITVEISDITGKLISTARYPVSGSSSGLRIIETDRLQTGTYNVRIKDQQGKLLLTEQILKR